MIGLLNIIRFFKKRNTIIINGQKIQTIGSNIEINGENILVDGQVVKNGLAGTVKIQFEGDIASIKSDTSVTVNGNVHGNVDAGGSIICQQVGRDVDAGGSVTCTDIQGDVDAGGSVTCGEIHGNVHAGGSVRYR
jgi:hypothetical protein